MEITVLNFVIAISGFLVGYFFARLDLLYVLLRAGIEVGPRSVASVVQQPTSFFDKEARADKEKKKANKLGGISIDSSKVVTKIDTDGIERGSNVEFGRTTSQQDGLKESVSKLSQLKGR